jgi:hypothetical protein
MSSFNNKPKKNIITIIKAYYWIAVIPLFIYGLISAIESKQDIDQHQTETFGLVYNSKPISKQNSRRNYMYKFSFKNKAYSGSSSAYLSENVKIGSFYKVEFSNKNPDHSRMLFDLEYLQKFKFDNLGNVTDTIYAEKNEELYNQMNSVIKDYEIKTN